jgi:hypothetical protein
MSFAALPQHIAVSLGLTVERFIESGGSASAPQLDPIDVHQKRLIIQQVS